MVVGFAAVVDVVVLLLLFVCLFLCVSYILSKCFINFLQLIVCGGGEGGEGGWFTELRLSVLVIIIAIFINDRCLNLVSVVQWALETK